MTEASGSNNDRPVVEVFADIACPFAYVGLSHLIRAREKRGASVQLHIRAWPLELVNDTPASRDDLVAEVAALSQGVGPGLFDGFDPDAIPKTSIPAFGLAHAAYEKDLETGEACSMELRREFFENGRDLSDPDVLGAVAERFGVELLDHPEAEKAVRSEWEEGQRRGVIGSPHFFLPDGSEAFNPGMQVNRLDDGSFEIETDLRAISTFFAPVFA